MYNYTSEIENIYAYTNINITYVGLFIGIPLPIILIVLFILFFYVSLKDTNKKIKIHPQVVIPV
jgi:hypothetical protein